MIKNCLSTGHQDLFEYLYKYAPFLLGMSEKCALCGEKIEETFLGKLSGARIKIKDEKKNKNELYAVCPHCQKKFPDVKGEVEKLLGP